ncbi:heme oxygenase (biliverdin-producing) [Streptomyces sp. NPDC059506]|uniref:biliverdin-producing heme oxygenase n=1 Tax=Streptomyces TaxID=1883 RepID=UPI0022AB4D63|nr:biliverdin-producing heme oxygenase [Streptomyces sp. HB2AG]MCZ2525212.1 biliverdin-producing heme oxygenase [Streptomyces sp. HB2AG]
MPPPPLSSLLRSATRDRHAEAEGSPFLGDLLQGRLGVDAWTRYTEQLWFVHRALEEGARALAGDPVAGPFLRPELMRTAALERDLEHLRGPRWREGVRPLPATAAYAERIVRTARTWPAGYVAHHYTRYLGELSGGQVVRSHAERNWGFAHKGDGVRSHVFEHVANPAALKREYRDLLDRLPVDGEERHRVVEECRDAFARNTAVLAELGREFPPGPDAAPGGGGPAAGR